MKKRARDATHDENVIPGTHADASAKAQHVMRSLIEAVVDYWPGSQVAIIVLDQESEERINYAANCDRKDMIAMFKALAHRLEVETQ